ncbi:MAG TPA: UDP-forming cellulose synthase catalytic subunit [Terracidiphilus sp.]|jgi:cellulose synthase (UDP-forming)|nr:UDP-forming cellulose synthase catalytic subunit [Terracidiphilus sp.]
MTATGLWQDIGAGENIFTKLLRLIFMLAAAVAFSFLAVLPLSWPQQAVCGLLTLLMALAIARSSDSYLVTLTLMIMSTFCTFRYGYWRVSQTILFFRDPSNHWGALDAFFILCLIFAEMYAFVILFLGYFQTIWPLRRAPVALPDDESEWPHIDVLIPTYNEPLDVVRYTALGALNMDWPADKLHVYILDDGRRKEFEEFAFEAGIGYKTRDDNKHAKAGNINAALKSMSSQYVAIFDSDHVPTRSFLQMTMGWFLRDGKLAMLQTPHHFYSPDPFERNLQQFRIIPNEGELFYGIVQDGNDFWNSTFFCGSCAVLRREALDEIGGIAVETVTEDAHTSLRMQMNGWGTAYINIPQAAGLATERLSAHVGQRIRWARGMIQILRTDNPLFAPGLKLAQRLCYFNAMAHFLYAVPRLIFLTAPLIYLILSHTNVPGYWAAILAYALPHLILSNVTNSRIQGEHRHSFWNEIYETVLSPYILLPTMMALINPKLGKFNVTAKGGVVRRTFFDTKIAQPFLILLLFNLAGILIAIPRYFIWDRDRPGTVLMNVMWSCFNVIILGVTTAVAREMRQLRTTVRIAIVTPVMARMPDGRVVEGETIDMSSGGTSIRFAEPVDVPPQTELDLVFPMPSTNNGLRAMVVSAEGPVMRVKFENLNIAEQEVLTMVLYSRADSWLGWGESRESDNVLRSLGRIFQISMHGLMATVQSLFNFQKPRKKASALAATTSATILGLAVLLGGAAPHAHAQPAVSHTGEQAGTVTPQVAAPATGQFRDTFSLADTGASQIDLHGIDSAHTVYFTLPQTHVPRSAKIHVSYAFSPSLLPQLSHIKLLMNGTLFATIEPTPNGTGGSRSEVTEGEFNIPPELMVHNNALTMEFIGHYVLVCEDPSNTTLWSRVHRSTYLDIQGDLLPLADDLKQLPLPFLDAAVVQPLSLPVVFASAPDAKAIQAAGIVTSYFGMISEGRPVRFPVHVGELPTGNAVIISDSSATLPAGLNMNTESTPAVAVRTNPNDPYGKVLVISGSDGDQLIQAAQAVALRSDLLQGPQATIDSLKLPNRRAADDAPRWAQTDERIGLWDYATTDALQGDGSTPLNVYFRIAPDIFYSERPNAVLRLAYRYNSVPIGPISSMQVRINNAFLGSVPLIPGQEASKVSQLDMPIPVVNLRPFSNSLSFDFTFQLLKKSNCQDTTPINMQGAVLRDSFIDLRGYPHYAPMPNLEIFANAGFPFTRYADLHNTTVVLPPSPTPEEIETFVTLMGHFGRQTGYPALRVTVAGPESMTAGSGADFLVIGAGDDQPAFDKLSDNLPVSLRSGKIQAHDTQGFYAKIHHAWWKVRNPDHAESGELIASGTPDAIVEGIESPYRPGSSVVAIHLRDASTFAAFMQTFLYVQQASDIQGTVSMLQGTRFQSFRMGSAVYHVGELPPWTKLTLWFREVPWLAAVVVILLAFLLAIWTRNWLRMKARARLKMLD